LLLNILPKPIAERMKMGETNIADSYPDVTVLVADLVGFTTLSAHIGSEQTVRLLDEIFSAFDLLTEKHVLEKLKPSATLTWWPAACCIRDQIMPKRAPNWRSICGKRLSNSTGSMIRPSHPIGICTGAVVAGVNRTHEIRLRSMERNRQRCLSPGDNGRSGKNSSGRIDLRPVKR